MTTNAPAIAPDLAAFRPARQQTSVPADELLTSADAGFLVLRQGQVRYEFRDEAVEFAVDLVELVNRSQRGHATLFLYEELLGVSHRLHWLLHLRHPNDYGRLLQMVDHDKDWREVAERDRLPEKGGGGWERMFVEGSITETVVCPQHGLGHGDHEDGATFQPAARHQTTLPRERLLDSGNAALTVHRVGQVGYAVREDARLFAFEWAGYVNEALTGDVTAFLYEEMWGQQDRLHILIHLASLDAYRELQALQEHDAGLRRLLRRRWAPDASPSSTWDRMFVDGTITETLWAPRHRVVAPPGGDPE